MGGARYSAEQWSEWIGQQPETGLAIVGRVYCCAVLASHVGRDFSWPVHIVRTGPELP